MVCLEGGKAPRLTALCISNITNPIVYSSTYVGRQEGEISGIAPLPNIYHPFDTLPKDFTKFPR